MRLRLAAPLLLAVCLAGGAWALFETNEVESLSSANFNSKLKKGAWAVAFYAPWCPHCKKLEAEWKKAGTALKGVVRVAAVDADVDKELKGRFGIQGYPTIAFMHTDKSGNIKLANLFEGERNAKEIVSWALEQAKVLAFDRMGEKYTPPAPPAPKKEAEGDDFYKGTDVVVLTDANFEEKVLKSKDRWLVEFYAPWCGFCKKIKPTYIDLAKAVKGKAGIGAVDCTVQKETCKKFGVNGFPTLKLFAADKTKPEEYDGDRSLEDLQGFVTGVKVAKKEAPKEEEFYVGTDVAVLTDADFEQKVLKSKDTWLIEFYAPWCGFCKRLKPTYIDLAKAVKGKASIGAVDCTTNRATCGKFGVNGYPTLKKFGADKDKPEDYEGERSLEDLQGFVTGVKVAKKEAPKEEDFYTGTDVVVLTDDDFEEKVLESGDNWLIEFYAPWCGFCKRLKSTYIDLAKAVKGKAGIGAVDCTVHKKVCGKYSVTGFPTLKKFGADKEKPEEYEGDRSLEDLQGFVTGEKVAKKEKPKEEDFYAGTDVVVLTDADFEEKVLKSDENWVVEFYAPWCGHCKNLKPTYIQLATAVKGQAKIGAMDCTDNRATCNKLNIPGFPTLKLFGADKEKPEEYDGDRTLEDLTLFAKGEKPPKEEDEDFYGETGVVVLTDNDFEEKVMESDEPWLIKFFAPWCGHCKNMKPVWADLPEAVGDKAKIGSVDCTTNRATCGKFGVNGYPTVKLFGKDKSKDPSDYEGDRTLEDLKGFATGEQPPKVKGKDFYASTDVVVLTDDDFEDTVVNSDETWAVNFFAPWCGFCKKLKETWAELATAVKGKAKVAAVDCTVHRKVCAKYDINGYPTLKLFGKDKEKQDDYEGDRALADMKAWVTGEQPPKPKQEEFYEGTDVVVLTDEDFEEKVLESKESWVVEFYAPWCGFCKKIKPTFIDLATAVKGKAAIGAVDCTVQRKTCAKYGVTGFPTLKLFGTDKSKDPEEYDGDRSLEDLKGFATGVKVEKPKEEEFYTGTDVVVLSDANFEEKVLKSKDNWLIEFYAPWCGFCKRIKPTYIDLAKAVKGKAGIGAVDCTVHKKVCGKYSVTGFPTLKKFGADKSKPEEYEGDRSLEDLQGFVTGEKVAKKEAPKEDDFYTGTDVVVLSDDNFEEKVLKSKDNWLIEFYAPWCGFCKRIKPTYIDLAKAVKGKAGIGAVDCTVHRKVCGKFGVNGYPTLKKFGADKDKPEDYEGDRSLEDLQGFVTGEKVAKKEAPKEDDFYTGTDVVVLTDDNFDEKVLKSKDNWLIEFYAPWCGFCKKIKPTYIDLAKAVKGKAGIGAVDCTVHKKVCGKFGVNGYPTIKKFGADKEKPEEYEGDRSLEDLQGFVTGVKVAAKEVPKEDDFYRGTDVAILTDDNFEDVVLANDDDWLVEFYAPWCGWCKRLKPTYIEVATALKGQVGVGAVDCTVEKGTCAKFGANGFPTLKRFGADKKNPVEFDGERTVEGLTAFATGQKGEVKDEL